MRQVVELPHGDWGASGAAGSEQTTTMRGAAFRPEYVQWSLRHRNLRRTSGVPLNNIFWCVDMHACCHASATEGLNRSGQC